MGRLSSPTGCTLYDAAQAKAFDLQHIRASCRRLNSYLSMMELREDNCSGHSSAETAAPPESITPEAVAPADAVGPRGRPCCGLRSSEVAGEVGSCSCCREPRTLSDWLLPAAVRRRYRELSMAVHPDKCSHPLANKVWARPTFGLCQM